MQFESGTLDAAGKVWTMIGTMTDPRTGQPLTKRSVITLLDHDRHRLEMFFETGGRESRTMEVEYTRAR
jgi:hypothetical protein